MPKSSVGGKEKLSKPRGLASGKKPETSSGATHLSTPSHDNAFTGIGGDHEAVVPITELWNNAYEQLQREEPKLIEKYEAEISLHVSTMVGSTVAISGLGKVQRREQMQVLVKQKLAEDEDGKWTIPLGDDRIAIRELAGRVVSIVDWGKEFVGAALESSPYGSIAWAGVCLLLPLILNPSKQRASNICGLEYISDLLSRCAMFEYAYHQQYEMNRDGPSCRLDLATGGYKNALKELYLRILRFQARSVCQFSRKLVSGGVRAMFKMDDWDALLEDIKRQEANCQTFFDSVKDQEALDAREEGHRQRTLLLLDRLKELNHGIKGIQDKLEEIHFSNEESKCFETLRTSDYLAQKDLNPERLPHTCKWFLDHPKYQGWVAQTPTSRLLWVSADPGCGKSVLAKALVDQYDSGSVCYYFFKDSTTITRSAAHAICAILHQICNLRPVFIRHVLPMYRRNGGKMVDLFEDLWLAFVNIINDKDFENVICVLDAIDECSDADYKKLLPRLAALAISPSTSVKVLITSRPYTSIETALFHKTGLKKNEIRLSGEASTEQSVIEKEVGFYISSKVQEFRMLRESNDIYDDVHEKLQSHINSVKNRTYLWVSAVFAELERDVDAPGYILMKTIKTLPDDVNKVYKNILEKSTEVKKPVLIRVLHITLAALRPLSVMEMNVALSVQETYSGSISALPSENSFSKYLRDLCGFFINIVDNEVYFTHQTAREFLVREEGYQIPIGWRNSFLLVDSHTLIAQICIDYLLLLYDGLMDATFEFYATGYWPAHCQSLEVDQSLANKVKSFLFQNGSVAPSFVKWAKIIDAGYADDSITDKEYYHRLQASTSSPPTPLFLACDFGWPSVIHVLNSSSHIGWNEKNKKGETGLMIAINHGYLEIVQLLLNAGADVNIQHNWKNTALHSAVEAGHLEIVQLLLNAGADVNIQDHWKRTALHFAVDRGHLEIVQLLLNAGADVSIQARWERTALHSAIKRGHLEIVQLLLNAGADVDTQEDEGKTALHLATAKGHLKIVQLLLNAGADVNIQEDKGKTALHFAADKVHFEIVQLPLNAGADVNIQNDDKSTALYFAAERGHLEIVQLLLNVGADVNIQDDWGCTALHSAVERGHVEIVQLLLNAGANVNIQSDSKSIALYSAVERGHLEIVQLLLNAGADVNIQNDEESTALHSAVKRDHLEILPLLLKAGADVNIQDNSNSTALNSAVERGHLEIVQLLLNTGAAVNMESGRGTALHWAATGGHLEIVKLLLNAGADVNIQSDGKSTALHSTAERGHVEIVQLLLNAGADVNIQDHWKRTALHSAIKRGHLEIVQLLLNAGADVNIQDNWGSTALHFAVIRSHLEIVQLLLNAGADVNIQNHWGGTALHFAIERGHLEIVQLLLHKGAAVNMESDQGTALHRAATEGHLEIVKLLLNAGADVDTQEDEGKTALHLAIELDHIGMVKLLLEAGADLNVESGIGTALQVAKRRNRVEIVQTILAAGASTGSPDLQEI